MRPSIFNKKYIVHPGLVVSRNGGGIHYLPPTQIMRLYGVHFRDCYVMEKEDYYPGVTQLKFMDFCKHLYPDYSGVYKIPSKNGIQDPGKHVKIGDSFMNRIQLADSILTIIPKLVEGNPGACRVVGELMQKIKLIDPDEPFRELAPLLLLDSYGIYGSRIWVLYKDVCGENLVHTFGVLRAVQIGTLSKIELNQAITDGVNHRLIIKELISSVRENYVLNDL